MPGGHVPPGRLARKRLAAGIFLAAVAPTALMRSATAPLPCSPWGFAALVILALVLMAPEMDGRLPGGKADTDPHHPGRTRARGGC